MAGTEQPRDTPAGAQSNEGPSPDRGEWGVSGEDADRAETTSSRQSRIIHEERTTEAGSIWYRTERLKTTGLTS